MDKIRTLMQFKKERPEAYEALKSYKTAKFIPYDHKFTRFHDYYGFIKSLIEFSHFDFGPGWPLGCVAPELDFGNGFGFILITVPLDDALRTLDLSMFRFDDKLSDAERELFPELFERWIEIGEKHVCAIFEFFEGVEKDIFEFLEEASDICYQSRLKARLEWIKNESEEIAKMIETDAKRLANYLGEVREKFKN